MVSSGETASPGDRVICALSGGADSVALLCLLLELRQELGLTVSAAHFHHGLRGEEADRDEALRPGALRRAGRCRSRSAGETWPQRPRERMNPRAGGAASALCVSVGTGRRPCRHGAPRRGQRRDDPAAPAPGQRPARPRRHPAGQRARRPAAAAVHARTAVRLSARERRCVDRGFDEFCRRLPPQPPAARGSAPARARKIRSLLRQLTRQSALLRAEDAFLDRQAQSLLDAARTPSGGYACRTLLQQMRCCKARDPAAAPRGAPAGCLAAARRGRAAAALRAVSLRLGEPAARCARGTPLRRNHRYGSKTDRFSANSAKNRRRNGHSGSGMENFQPNRKKNIRETANTPFHFAVKYDMIVESNLIVRPRRPGDRLQRAGGSKSLKELFIDRKIPHADRALLPVFAAQGEILAVAGLGVSSKFQPQAGAPALWIRIEKERM